MGPLNVVFHWVFTEELTHTVVSSAHTVVVCVVRRRRESGPGKHGALKVVFQ